MHFFVIASQETEGIDWLVTQPRTHFSGMTSPQRRKLVPPPPRLLN